MRTLPFYMIIAINIFASPRGTIGICSDCCATGKHYTINDWTRSIAYKLPSGQTSRCDNRIRHGWYRFTSKAGGTIPNSCPPANSCGTMMPVWVSGNLPPIPGVEVYLTAKGRYATDCAYDNWRIKARRCSVNGESFYIYYLTRMTLCMGYCAGTERPCEAGQTSPTGYTPGCRKPFPPITLVPTLSVSVEKVNGKEFVDFKCRFGQLENNTFAMYNVSWFNGSAMHLKTEVIAGRTPKEAHTPLQELHTSGFKLGDSIFCRVNSWYSNVPGQGSAPKESNHFFAGFEVEPKQLEFTISESDRTHLQLTVKSTIPIICNGPHCVVNVNVVQDYGGEQAGLSDCRLSFWRSNTTQEKRFNITARQDKVLDGNRAMHIQLAVHRHKSFTPVEWNEHLSIPKVKVLVKDIPFAQCLSYGDPNIQTFDGVFYRHYYAGDYVLVEHTHRPFEIHVRTYHCGGATCNCGLAAREGDDVVVIDTCRGGAPTVSFPSSKLVEPNEATRVKRDESGRNFVIEFESGTKIEFYSTTGLGNLNINIPSAYLGYTRGLCGSYDMDKSNDLKDRNGNIWQNGAGYVGPTGFTESWRLATGTSLFYYKPAMAKCNKNETIRYCQCTAPEGVEEDIIIKCNTKLISYDEKYQIGSAGYKEYRFPALQHCGNRQRPPTGKDIDLPDQPDPDYRYEPNNTNVITPTWPTKKGKTRLEVTNRCDNAIRNSQAGKICTRIDSFDFQPYVVQCISDVQVSDDYLYVSSAVMAMTTVCKELLFTNETLWKNKTRPPDEFRDITCLNSCSGQGACRNGTCACNSGFISADCSIDSTKGPNITSIVNGGLCDIRKQRDCFKVRVIGSDFMDSNDLSCRATEIEPWQNTVTGVQTNGNASMISFAEIICQLRPFRIRSFGYSVQSKGDAYTGHRIAVTNDGNKFSKTSLLYRVYDSNCVNCQNGICKLKNNTCMVNGYCFRYGELDPGDSCKKCIPSSSKTAFIREPFPPISFVPAVNPEVEKVNNSEFLDFKCKLGQLENNTLAMYNVSWFRSTPAIHLKTEVIAGNAPREIHATLHELHALGFRLGDTIFCKVTSWYSNRPSCSSPAKESNHFFAGFKVEPKEFTISESDRQHFELKVKATIPIVCNAPHCPILLHVVQSYQGNQASLSECRLIFRKSSYPQEKSFKVAANRDRILDGNRVMHIQLQINKNKTYTQVEWKEHLQIPTVKVLVKDVAFATCTSNGDPNIRTFDRVFYRHYYAGDYVLVQNTCGNFQFQVHVRTYHCRGGTATCNCGIAAREGDDVVVVDTCRGGAPTLSFPSSRLVEPNNATRITRDASGRNFVIEFESGAKIVFYSTSGLGDLSVTIPSQYFGCTRGMCGSYDNDASNDLKDRNGNIWSNGAGSVGPAGFTESWRLSYGASLFYYQPTQKKCNKRTTRYCKCERPEIDGDDIVIDCSIDPDNYKAGNSGNKEFRFPGLEHCGYRQRPSTSNTIDLPNTGPPTDYFYDPPNRNVVIPTWPTRTGKTRLGVTNYCNNAIRNSQAGTVCGRMVAFNIQPYIDQCAADIQVADDYSFVSSAVMAMASACNELLSTNMTYWQTRNNKLQPPTELGQITCPGLCSGRGRCQNRACVCNPGFTSADCSIDATRGPTVTSIVNGGFCDVRKQRDCTKIRVIGSDFMDSKDLSCRMSEIEPFGNKATGVQHNGNASMISFAEVICQLRPLRVQSFGYSVQSKGDAYTGHRIEVTNDGSKFSETSLLYRVYDSNCISCQNGTCQIKNDTCMVNGYCYRTGEIDPFNFCNKCIPSKNREAFISEPFPPIASTPSVSAEVEKIGNSEVLDFKCRFGRLENSTRAMYNVSWFNSTALLKTEVINGSSPREIHETLHDVHALGFRLGDTIFCKVISWYSNVSACPSPPKESNHFFAGFTVEPKKFEFQISESDREHLQLKVKATIPIICSTPHCVVIVNVVQQDESGQAVLSDCQLEFWKSNQPQQKRFNVTAKLDRVLDGNRVMHIQLKVNHQKKFIPLEWKKHLPIPKVKVSVKDAPFATCSSTGDPHITTFDNMYYHQYIAGDYALVINTCRMFQVHVRTSACGNVACNCGVAVREGDDVIIINVCDGVPKLSFPSRKLVEPNQEIKVKRDGTGRNFVIELPSGTRINFQTYGKYGSLYVSIPSNDFKCTRGLCGTFDKDGTNELIDRSGKRWTNGRGSIPVDFTESWRFPAGTSLFYYKPTKTKCNKGTQRHCTCTPPDDIDEDLVINCNSDSTLNNDINKVGCWGYTEYRFSETKHCNHTRRKRSCKTIEMPDEDETTVSIYDPKPRKITVPTWPTITGKTLAGVTIQCSNAIRNSQAGRVCNMIESFDFQLYIDQCVEDTKISDDYSFVRSAMMAMAATCEEVLSTNMTYWETKNNTSTPPAEIGEITCPGLCSSQGTCRNGTCICNAGFISADCSINATKGPTVTSIVNGGLCDIRKQRDCSKVRVIGSDFMDSDDLSCRAIEIEPFGNTTTGVQHIGNASMISFAEIICQLRPHRVRSFGDSEQSKGDAYTGHRIAVTNDGNIFSERSLLYRVYDSNCVDCQNGTCKIKNNTCLVNGSCFRSCESDPNNSSMKCLPSKNSTTFVRDTMSQCNTTTQKPMTITDDATSKTSTTTINSRKLSTNQSSSKAASSTQQSHTTRKGTETSATTNERPTTKTTSEKFSTNQSSSKAPSSTQTPATTNQRPTTKATSEKFSTNHSSSKAPSSTQQSHTIRKETETPATTNQRPTTKTTGEKFSTNHSSSKAPLSTKQNPRTGTEAKSEGTLSEMTISIISTSAVIGFIVTVIIIIGIVHFVRKPGKIPFGSQENETLELGDKFREKIPFHSLQMGLSGSEESFPPPPDDLLNFESSSQVTSKSLQNNGHGRVLVNAEDNKAFDFGEDVPVGALRTNALKFENNIYGVQNNNQPKVTDAPTAAGQHFPVNSQDNKAFERRDEVTVASTNL